MNFFYEAVDSTGKTVVGKLDAADAADAQRQLVQSGYRPQSIAPNPTAAPGAAPPVAYERTLMANPPGSTAVAVRPPVPPPLTTQNEVRVPNITLAGEAARMAKPNRPTGAPKTSTGQNVSNLGGVSTRDLMFFFQQFASLTRSGINVYSALQDLALRTKNKNLAQATGEMAEQSRTGGRISDVMEKYPRIFPEHNVGMVRAGELGGFLDIALSEIATNYEQNIALYRGSWIPRMLATQSLYVLALAQPLFTTMFRIGNDGAFNFGDNVVLYLKLAFLRNLPIAFGLHQLIRLGGRRLQLPQYRMLRDSWSLRVPPFGDLQRQAAIAAFVRMLRRLYHAGVPPIQAWEGAMNTASNVAIREKLGAAYGLMEKGASLPDAFQATGLFTNQVENLIITGHQSGEVVESLDKIADYYQEQVGEAAGKSRFAMMRMGIMAMLILGGITSAWLLHTYFSGMFNWVDKYFAPE